MIVIIAIESFAKFTMLTTTSQMKAVCTYTLQHTIAYNSALKNTASYVPFLRSILHATQICLHGDAQLTLGIVRELDFYDRKEARLINQAWRSAFQRKVIMEDCCLVIRHEPDCGMLSSAFVERIRHVAGEKLDDIINVMAHTENLRSVTCDSMEERHQHVTLTCWTE